jgi:hypothetical protein
MKTYLIEIAGRKERLTLPESWNEMVLGHLIDLEAIEQPTALEVFNVLAGRDVSAVSPEFEDELLQAVAFVYSPPDWDKIAPPTHLVIQGVPYPVPKIEQESLGQGIMVSQILAKAADLRETVIPILATYFQPLVDRTRFDRLRVPAVEKMLRNTAAVEGFATASHFLAASATLRRIIKVASPLLSSPRMRRLSGTTTRSPESSSGSTTSSGDTRPTPMMISSTLSMNLP